MAKFRLVHTSFWDDPTVVEEMTAEDKYFFLYLLTNERTTQIGIYQTTKKQIAFDIGYSIESTGALLQRFTDHHKIIKYNPETREIAIKNWGKYNLVRGGKPIIDCVKSELSEVKDNSLIQYVGENVPNDSIRIVYESYYVTCHDTHNVTSDDTKNENEQKGGESSNTKGSYVTYHDTYNDTATIRGQEKEQQEEQQEEKEEEQEQTTRRIVGGLVDSKFAEVVNLLSANIGELNEFKKQEISFIYDEHDPDLVIEATKEMLRTEKIRQPIRYIEGILNRWNSDGVTNLATLEVYRKRGEQNGTSNHGNRGNSQKNGVASNPYEVARGYCSD